MIRKLRIKILCWIINRQIDDTMALIFKYNRLIKEQNEVDSFGRTLNEKERYTMDSVNNKPY